MLLVAIAAILPAATRPAAAQAPAPVVADSSARVASRGPLLRHRDVIAAGVFAAGTAAAFALDEPIAHAMQRPGAQGNRVARHLATDFRLLAIPGTVIAAPALWLVGRVAHKPRVADLGLHAGEAIVAAEAIGFAIKGAAGRARPYATHDSAAFDFDPGHGFAHDSLASFPSGHAIAAFAGAAVVTSELGRWWPHATKFVAPVAFGGATLVGVSRLYSDQHWASDVVLAAGIGTITGIGVVHFNHDRPRNAIDRWLLPLAIAPAPSGGVSLAYTVPLR